MTSSQLLVCSSNSSTLWLPSRVRRFGALLPMVCRPYLPCPSLLYCGYDDDLAPVELSLRTRPSRGRRNWAQAAMMPMFSWRLCVWLASARARGPDGL